MAEAVKVPEVLRARVAGPEIADVVGGALVPVSVTVTVSEVLPDALEHVSRYVLAVVMVPVDSEPPDTAFDPDQFPAAVHAVGLFVVVQERVADCPERMVRLS